MDKVKASLLISAKQESTSNLERIAEGRILIINGKQFVVDQLNNVDGTYNFNVLRREAFAGKEGIHKIHYQLIKQNRAIGKLVRTSIPKLLYPPSQEFENASDRLKVLQLKNKQHPY